MEKTNKYLKAFLLGLAGTLIGSILFIAVHGLLEIVTALLYVLTGVSAAVFYLYFTKKENRNAGTHILLDASLAIGVFLSQLFDFAFCYAPKFNIPGNDMNTAAKVFYVYFTHPDPDSIIYDSASKSANLVTSAGALSVWTAFILYLISAFIGLYAVFAVSKIAEKTRKKK